MKMLIPQGKKVLVQLDEDKEITHKGIILPSTNQERFIERKIHAVGDEIEGLNIGDLILVDRHLGKEILFHDQKYLLLKQEEILGLIYQKGISDSGAPEDATLKTGD